MSASLASSSAAFAGKKIQSRRQAARAPVPKMSTKAKYGDESVYFDLDDLESTAGSWDMYGVDSGKRYPAIQEKFFANAADGVTRRDAMYSFIALAGGAGFIGWGALGSKQVELPITKGPQKTPEVGPRGRL